MSTIRGEVQSDEWTTQRVEKILKWKKRLESLVGRTELLWLPRIRSGGDVLEFTIQGEPAVMKFMKHPVAKWAHEETERIMAEIRDMFHAHPAQKKLVPDQSMEEIIASIDDRFKTDPDLKRLWLAGE